MATYLICITVIGMAALLMAWMPAISQKTKVSYSIVYVVTGMILYMIFTKLPDPDPLLHEDFTVHLTELIVIISLMGTGLKIDEPFAPMTWSVPLRLVSITMVLCIAAMAVLCKYALGMDWASSILIGACLAPTDPVLASDVQVGPPMEGDKGKVHFSLTAEAGMNDGTAFPFTWLAIAVAMLAGNEQLDVWHWVWKDLVYRVVAGVAMGFIIGRILAYFVFDLPERKKAIQIKDGFVAVSATLLVYGFTELVHGYGFIAVFVTAITLRNYEINHKYHKNLHDFTDQIERILIAIVLILFGGAIVSGLLNALTWPMILLSLAFLLIIRPALVWLTLYDIPINRRKKWAIGFLGIRGIGSFFYLSFALLQAKFSEPSALWSIVGFIVLISIIIHGFTATSLLEKLPTNNPPIKEQLKR
ncbi:cation:proton antiporter [Aridibaculum aurantiacum]|uniref:cation:proton antiporter n=1 Tax=Aridibaculum aurantiacum TaxID=2810307 RepID=UPI001A956635|nr:cation:proton antiporter [Aridibaculum aurantiacum]